MLVHRARNPFSYTFFTRSTFMGQNKKCRYTQIKKCVCVRMCILEYNIFEGVANAPGP